MKNSKRIASVVLSSTLILSSTVGVFAKPYDLIDKNTNKTYEVEEWTFNEDLIIDSTLNGTNYKLEVNDKIYALNEIMTAIGTSDKTPEEVVAGLTPVGEAQKQKCETLLYKLAA